MQYFYLCWNSSFPKERLALWPLDKASRIRLRLLSPWVNPITWLLAAFAVWAVWREESRSLVALCAALVAVGFFFPVVPKGQARIRVQVSAVHERHHLEKAVAAFTQAGRELGLIPA